MKDEGAILEIVESYLAELESGGAPDKERLLRAHPEVADQLEACLGSLEFVCKAARGNRMPAPEAVPELPEARSQNLLVQLPARTAAASAAWYR